MLDVRTLAAILKEDVMPSLIDYISAKGLCNEEGRCEVKNKILTAVIKMLDSLYKHLHILQDRISTYEETNANIYGKGLDMDSMKAVIAECNDIRELLEEVEDILGYENWHFLSYDDFMLVM